MEIDDLSQLELALNKAQKEAALARSRLAKRWRDLLMACGATPHQAETYLDQMDEFERFTDGLTDVKAYMVSTRRK